MWLSCKIQTTSVLVSEDVDDVREEEGKKLKKRGNLKGTNGLYNTMLDLGVENLTNKKTGGRPYLLPTKDRYLMMFFVLSSSSSFNKNRSFKPLAS